MGNGEITLGGYAGFHETFMMTLQPISTAPRDGTWVLLWSKNLLHGQCSFAVAQYIQHDIEWWHVHDGKFGPYPIRGEAPTHWMPLPEL